MPSSLLAQVDVNLRELAAEHDIPFVEETLEEGGAGRIATRLLNRFFEFAMVVGSIILLFNLVYAGIEWISAGGDSGKIEKARNRIVQSIIGILVLSASAAIFMVVNQLLGSPLDIRFVGGSGGTGGGPSGAGNPACVCWNGLHAMTSARGRLVNTDDSPCYLCTNSGWQLVEGTCGVITCY